MPKNNNLIIAVFTFLLFLFIFINSNTHFSYTPPSPIKDISTKNEFTNNYQGLLNLQEAFVRNAKIIKPSVVSINKVKEVFQKSSWYDINPQNSMSWIVKIKSWFSKNRKMCKNTNCLGSAHIVPSVRRYFFCSNSLLLT